MKILLGLIATLSVALVPALAETAKERAHEKVAAEAPPTDSSEQIAAQQIDKSYSSLKAALAGMIKSRKKGDLNAFALYKQQAIDALNQLSKQASLAINTEAAEKANEIKSGTMPTPTPVPTPTRPHRLQRPRQRRRLNLRQLQHEATATPTPEPTATPTPEATATPTPEATATPEPTATPESTPTPEPTATPTPQ